MPNRKFLIHEETKARCNIIPVPKDLDQRFNRISMELFHFLYEADSIDFSIFFRAGSDLIEFITPKELSKELLDKIKNAMNRDYDCIAPYILKNKAPNLQNVITKVRQEKIESLLEKDPNLDRKTLEIFGNLSNASQMIVKGGIGPTMAAQVTASASVLVDSLMNCEIAIDTLSKMIHCDPTLYDHSATVAMLSGLIGNRLIKNRLNYKQTAIIAQCGLYHDVGKTCIPHHILNKPTSFEPDEFEIMKTHTTEGNTELNKAIEQGAPIEPICARVALEHHERFMGHGYPFGKKGRLEESPNGIHLYTRIVTVADVYSALLMQRVYKPAYEPSEAIKIMVDVAEKDYDPDIFLPFLKEVLKSLNYYTEPEDKEPESKLIITDDWKKSS